MSDVNELIEIYASKIETDIDILRDFLDDVDAYRKDQRDPYSCTKETLRIEYREQANKLGKWWGCFRFGLMRKMLLTQSEILGHYKF